MSKNHNKKSKTPLIPVAIIFLIIGCLLPIPSKKTVFETKQITETNYITQVLAEEATNVIVVNETNTIIETNFIVSLQMYWETNIDTVTITNYTDIGTNKPTKRWYDYHPQPLKPSQKTYPIFIKQ